MASKHILNILAEEYCLVGMWFVFIGQNELEETPHPKTFKRSHIGSFYGFYSKEDADRFAAIMRKIVSAPIVKSVSIYGGRDYKLSLSMKSYCAELSYSILNTNTALEFLKQKGLWNES